MKKLNDKELIELTKKAQEERIECDQIRLGQSYMNALYTINPVMYKEITNTDADCFHSDRNIKNFFNVITNIKS